MNLIKSLKYKKIKVILMKMMIKSTNQKTYKMIQIMTQINMNMMKVNSKITMKII